MNVRVEIPTMQTIGVVGWHNSGKTTLITRLIPALADRGLSVSTVKPMMRSFSCAHAGFPRAAPEGSQGERAGSLGTKPARSASVGARSDAAPPGMAAGCGFVIAENPAAIPSDERWAALNLGLRQAASARSAAENRST